ncbi:hypothetical protein Tcan_03010 [Toxocara canis]|uniref:Transmembrane protein n=2 Tax=Toxocara canis TaxID=6265 RepID=A0A0B2UVH1_TOXCA|nr:hypothetical protein Tcan_03010 [Toxocara canis]VDM46757.1 unnamed protein product [Toxocara canis]
MAATLCSIPFQLVKIVVFVLNAILLIPTTYLLSTMPSDDIWRNVLTVLLFTQSIFLFYLAVYLESSFAFQQTSKLKVQATSKCLVMSAKLPINNSHVSVLDVSQLYAYQSDAPSFAIVPLEKTDQLDDARRAENDRLLQNVRTVGCLDAHPTKSIFRVYSLHSSTSQSHQTTTDSHNQFPALPSYYETRQDSVSTSENHPCESRNQF